MLELLRITGLGVIDDAELELSPGLTVLTGETGAGKTMVVTGLGLLLGGKADAGRVRPGCGSALVEGRVRLGPEHPGVRLALTAGAELDEGDLLVSRSVSAEGRSRSFLGGRAVPVGVLAEVGDELVAVHGQHDQRRLLQPARQRGAIDRFAGSRVAALLERYAAGHARLVQLGRDLDELTTRARDRAQEADLLRFGLAEIEAVDPQPGEDAELAAEESRLAHADGLREAAVRAHAAVLGELDGGDGADAVGLLAAARSALESASVHDPGLAALGARLAEASYLIADVAADLSSYAASVDTDPLRLAAVQDRRASVGVLTRKYGATADDVLAWSQRSAVRLDELEHDDEHIDVLRVERDTLTADLGDLAGQLSDHRRRAARRFAAAISAELAALAMPHATVTVEVRQTDDPAGLPVGGRRLAFGATGVDDVEILLASHPGAPARALDKGASGGELSRVMLAVEVVFAGADPVPTFVFDEVDAGVGGRAAVEIGRRLAQLAREAQVLVVTHLPQVAAFADRHLRVVKSDDGRVTRSGVVVLDDEARVRELSRMLAGLEGSDTAVAHARELLDTARRSRPA